MYDTNQSRSHLGFGLLVLALLLLGDLLLPRRRRLVAPVVGTRHLAPPPLCESPTRINHNQHNDPSEKESPKQKELTLRLTGWVIYQAIASRTEVGLTKICDPPLSSLGSR